MSLGLLAVQRAMEEQKIRTYWAMGRQINTYLSRNDPPRGAIGRFYSRLAADLGVSGRTLQHCEQFYRYYPALEIASGLSWSHYRFLLTEPDAEKRRRWISRIQKEGLSSGQLRLSLLSDPAAPLPQKARGPLPAPARGQLYLYRILRAEDIDSFEVPWFVDLGFACRREAPPAGGVLNNKYLYTSEKTEAGLYVLKACNAKTEELFTFRARLRRVIDGDTLLVVADLGFGVWTEQRLRLAGIDAPELSTLAGQQVKKRVIEELRHAPDLVVKTYQTDKWDRYLADVFYPDKAWPRAGQAGLPRIAQQGLWLNGWLVDNGLAEIWDKGIKGT
jgi:endonuclease YncB( thermonuclease family)